MSFFKVASSVTAMLAMAASVQASMPSEEHNPLAASHRASYDAAIAQPVMPSADAVTPITLAAWSGQCEYFISTGATEQMLANFGCN